MDLRTKVHLAETYAKISESEMCRRMGTTSAAFCQRLKNPRFSEEDYEKIAKALGCEISIVFRFPDGTVFE